MPDLPAMNSGQHASVPPEPGPTPDSSEEVSANWHELAATVRFVARCWLSEVDSSSLLQMRHPKVQAAFFADAGSKLLPDYESDAGDQALLDALAVEYCQLLVGPRGHVSPVESVHTSNQFQSESASSMQRYFDLLPGFVPPASLPDHFGVQLDYVAELLDKAAEADSTARDIAQLFVAERLAWTGDFLAQVKSHPVKSNFYCWLAQLSSDLIETLRAFKT